MAKTVGDFLFERLAAWNVRRIFGYPGDGINGIVSALGRAGTRSNSSRSVMKKRPRSWRRAMPR